METSYRVAALVPMRHHSQRVPGKNYRPLAGRPLFTHILDALNACKNVSTILIDTDSQNVMDIVRAEYPQVVLLERPEHLRADDIPMNEILLHDTSQIEADFFLQTHSTNPLLKSETIERAIDIFLKNYPAFDSLFGVTRRCVRLWDQLTRPINHNPAILLQTQDLPPVFEENSCMYIFRRDTLETRRNRLGERPYMFEISPAEAWDIDEEIDFMVCDALMREKSNQA